MWSFHSLQWFGDPLCFITSIVNAAIYQEIFKPTIPNLYVCVCVSMCAWCIHVWDHVSRCAFKVWNVRILHKFPVGSRQGTRPPCHTADPRAGKSRDKCLSPGTAKQGATRCAPQLEADPQRDGASKHTAQTKSEPPVSKSRIHRPIRPNKPEIHANPVRGTH